MTDAQLASPCWECGYAYASLDRAQTLAAVTSLADEHCLLLCSVPAERLRDHPRQASWSSLEYGCHIRDVLRIQRERILLAQAEQTPLFPSMRRDERAIEERYNDQDPLAVADEIRTAAGRLSAVLVALDHRGWERAGIYPWPAPQARSVSWIARWTTHELAHHLFDIQRLLGQA